MRPLLRTLSQPFFLCLLLLLLLQPPGAQAGTTGATGAAATAINGSNGNGNGNSAPLPDPDSLRKQLDAIPAQLGESDDGRKLLNDSFAVSAAAAQLVARRSSELADLDSRLAGLGPAPEKGAAADAPDVAEQRKALNRQRAAVDAELKLARLIGVDAQQRGSDLARQRREQFQAALTARSVSPLGQRFWRNLGTAWPADQARLQALGEDLQQALSAALAPGQRKAVVLSLAASALIAVLGTWLAELLLVRVLPPRLPAGRLRRSLLATVSVIINVLIIGYAVQLAWNGLTASGNLTQSVQALGKSVVSMAALATFVIALGHALLSRKRSSWRLLPISDRLAARLAPYPWWIGLLAALSGLAMETNALIGASLTLEVTVQVVSSLLLAGTIAISMRPLREAAQTPRQASAAADGVADAGAPAPLTARPMWLTLLVACIGIAAAATYVLVALGFVALAGAVASQMVWTAVVVATVYLLLVLADDLCMALLSSKGAMGARLNQGLGISASLLDQLAVVLSGMLRVTLCFYLVIALLAPFGTGPDEVLRRGNSSNHGLRIGELSLSPQALFTALAVVCAGFLMVRIFKRWLSERYFPHTELEPGMRSSIATLLGYIGCVVVIAVALAGLGISVERIAWVASALSVGIGFGLQAIVQNFISGLILLAERPVKVGDWVKLGDTEGDVRRVNVRATEIQLGDRSTVIVPNSEFITKSVRNMTQSGAQGRVLLQLPAPLTIDARQMRELLLKALHEHPDVLAAPAPSVTLDGIQNGTLTFQAVGYVDSPRQVSGVRSELLFTILEALRSAGLSLSPPATTSVPAVQSAPDLN